MKYLWLVVKVLVLVVIFLSGCVSPERKRTLQALNEVTNELRIETNALVDDMIRIGADEKEMLKFCAIVIKGSGIHVGYIQKCEPYYEYYTQKF